MLVDAPAAGFEAEVGEHGTRRAVNVPSPLLSATYTPASPKPDDVGTAVAGDVGDEARMLVDAPAAGSKPKSATTGCGVNVNVPSPLLNAT